MKKLLVSCAFIFCTYISNAQSLAVNGTGAAADASAILDVQSTSKGLLVPRMTAAEKALIASPATGLTIYQTDGSTGFYTYNGTGWIALLNGGSTLDASKLSGSVAVANGGTGSSSLTANNVLLGNGTSAVQAVAPGTTGNVLTSNGTTWVSQAAPGGAMNVLTKSTNYTISSSDVANNLLLVASANITITLPQSSLSTGKIVYVSSPTGGAFTVVCPSGNTFGGNASVSSITNGAATFVADGTGKWHIVTYVW